MEQKEDRAFRLLDMYERLIKGEPVKKGQLADETGVSLKTVQRDIDDLRAYLAERNTFEKNVDITYDKANDCYRLKEFGREWMTREQVLAVCKILFDSRAFSKEECEALIDKLLEQVIQEDQKIIREMILSELHNYVPPKHQENLLDRIWKFSEYIHKKKTTEITYTRLDGTKREHMVNPVAIMFSEYYFYLIAYMANNEKDSPTVFRIDRIKSEKMTDQSFYIPYSSRFNEGEFRKRVQFMYSGELHKVKFKYSGLSLEAVQDRLPTAQVISKDADGYIIQAEVYGKEGIRMWLRSQGDAVTVLED